MVSIKTRSRVNAQGTLSLEVSTGLPESEVEVLVVLQPVHSAASATDVEELGWPPGFFEETFGSTRDQALQRHPQGEFELRDELT